MARNALIRSIDRFESVLRVDKGISFPRFIGGTRTAKPNNGHTDVESFESVRHEGCRDRGDARTHVRTRKSERVSL